MGELYLGAVQLPFVSTLRVYLPREAYTATEFAYIERHLPPEQSAVSVDAAELADSLVRVVSEKNAPLPTAEADLVRVLRMGAEEPLLYAPNQLVTRSIAGAAELLEGSMGRLATLVLPKEVWEENIRNASAEAQTTFPIQTRSSTWGIPFSWFTLIYANDRMEVVQTQEKILTVRVQVPVTVAAGRVARMEQMLAHMARDLDLFSEMQELRRWLAQFAAGVVELDYGPLAGMVHPDESPADVHMGLQCLADGDFTGAAAAYRRLANRWMPIRALARAN